MEEGKARYRYHRAWPLLLFSLLCYFMTGTVSSIMNVSVGIMEAERGWNATLLTASMSIASLVNVVTGFVAGRMSSKGSAKRACLVWGVLYCVGILLMGVSSSAGLFVVAMVAANAASSAWGYNTVPVLITNWFPTKKGSVQGFTSMGILLGSFSTVLYTQTYRMLGSQWATVPFAIVAGITLLVMALGVTDCPEQSGLAPDTMDRVAVQPEFDPSRLSRGEATSGDSGEGEKGKLPSREAARGFLRDPKFLAMTAILGIQLVFSGGIMVQVVPRLVEVGFSLDEATAVLIISSVCACVGSFAFGVIGDKYGVDRGVRLSFAVGLVAALMNLTGQRVVVFASLVLIGVVVGCADNWPVNVCAELYGREGFSVSFGVMQPVIQLVGAAGPAAFALVANATGSYDASFVMAAVMMGVGLVAYSALMHKA